MASTGITRGAAIGLAAGASAGAIVAGFSLVFGRYGRQFDLPVNPSKCVPFAPDPVPTSDAAAERSTSKPLFIDLAYRGRRPVLKGAALGATTGALAGAVVGRRSRGSR
jgi:hypothetical protein